MTKPDTIYGQLDDTRPLSHVRVTSQDQHAMRNYEPLLELSRAVAKANEAVNAGEDGSDWTKLFQATTEADAALAAWIEDFETPKGEG